MPTSSHPRRANVQAEIRGMLPRLSPSQANVLGEMAYAMLMVDSCGMTRMCSFLSELLDQPVNTLRQRYREMYYEKEAKAGVKKRGLKRREIVVEEHFADLLRGVLRDWQGPKILVLALDGSTLSTRFDVLSISVVTRGCGIRVAWTILPGHQAGEWRAHWERLLERLAEAVPAEWSVLVMADRGLYAPWLFEAICANGWHPFLRVKKGMTFQAEGEESFQPIGERVKRPAGQWRGRGVLSETGVRLQATLLVRWEVGYEEPICVVTDLAVAQGQAAWYQMRFWIEDEYKDGKRGWFHWEHSKMKEPGRASRLWLVLGIVLQKAILVGSELEAREQAEQARRRKKRRGGRVGRPCTPERRPRGREQSVLMRGVMAMRAAESGRGKIFPTGQIRAEPLPTRLYPARRECPSHQLKKRRKEARRRTRRQGKRQEQREQRQAARLAKTAATQAKKQEKQERRAAKEAAQPARRQEKQERGSSRGAPTGRSPDPGRARPTNAEPRLRLFQGRLLPPHLCVGTTHLPSSSSRPQIGVSEPREPGAAGEALSDVSLSREPLLRLVHGRLLPPHRLVPKDICHDEVHGPAPGAGP